MTTRSSRRWTLVCAAALSLGVAASVQAQDTTSQRRIPIRKQSSGGEVITAAERARLDSIARADSIAREQMRLETARRDSIAAAERARAEELARLEQMRRDSIAAVEKSRADSIAAIERARADSIARAEELARAEQLRREQMRSRGLFRGSGWYLGFAAGPSDPSGTFETLGYNSGYNITVPIGYHKLNQLLGFRLDLGFNSFDGATFTSGGPTPITVTNPDPKVYSASLNVTARLPIGKAKTTALYGVGGTGMYMYRNLGSGSALSAFVGNDVLDPNAPTSTESSISKWGWNYGAGFEFAIGPAGLFFETRVEHTKGGRDNDIEFDEVFGSDRSNTVRWMPLIVGIKFR